jgi:hypothetical protein
MGRTSTDGKDSAKAGPQTRSKVTQSPKKQTMRSCGDVRKAASVLRGRASRRNRRTQAGHLCVQMDTEPEASTPATGTRAECFSEELESGSDAPKIPDVDMEGEFLDAAVLAKLPAKASMAMIASTRMKMPPLSRATISSSQRPPAQRTARARRVMNQKVCLMGITAAVRESGASLYAHSRVTPSAQSFRSMVFSKHERQQKLR